MDGNSDDTVPIFSELTENQANSYGLVLTASGFSYFLMQMATGWEIRVPFDQAYAAQHAINRYLEENTEIIQPDQEAWPDLRKTGSALWACLVLVAVFVAAQGDGSRELIDDFGEFTRLKGGPKRNGNGLVAQQAKTWRECDLSKAAVA